MSPPKRHPLLAAVRVIWLGTLSSRVLGMVRDMATAALLGLSTGGVMDAFVIGQRIPNLVRRLFAEGALAVSYLPVVTRLLVEDRRRAWQLASVLLTCLAVFMTALVLLGECACGLIWLVSDRSSDLGLLLGLTAAMLPYALFICLAAQVAATLNALGHFAAPAFAPVLLNLCWLAGAWLVAPYFAPDQVAQAYVLAVCVVVAGVLQLAVQLAVLYRFEFHFDFHWAAGREALGEVIRAMGPMVLGLAATQVNTLLDSLIAWGLSAAPDGPQQIAWLPGGLEYPMRQGATAAIYYGERLYQFPLGILGMTVATAIFPLLSRHATQGRHDRLGSDLTLGLRLVLCLGVPAGVGLMLLGEPLVGLIFQHGRFNADDTARTAGMIGCYAAGVWAYCALPVVVRGFYSLGNQAAPVRIGLGAVGLNLALNLTLIWPLAERGLAVATAAAASIQVVVLVAVFSRRHSPLDWRALRKTLFQTTLATAAMAGVGVVLLRLLPDDPSLASKLIRVAIPTAACLGAYGVVYRLSGGREINMLLGRAAPFPEEPSGVDWFEEHADYEEE
ncbi:MAG: murein biosynthesis integral membrane protein MurJ [Pirellulales bacterium]|nr:murein biosynthesis integral membrane protein MurJ [Pirellulales bacterium]